MLTLAQKQKIYNDVRAERDFGVYPMPNIFLVLRDTENSHKNYGYEKGKAFILDMPEFFELLTEDRPVTEPDIRFFEWNGQEASADLQETSADFVIKQIVPESFEDKELLTQPLSDWTFFPSKNTALLSSKTGIVQENICDLLNDDFKSAYENGKLEFYEDKISFPLSVATLEQIPISIVLKPSASTFQNAKPWFFNYIYENRAASKAVPGKKLEQFAFLGSWFDFLSELSDLALPESWNFANENGGYSILKSYIQYTFARLCCENKVCVSEDGEMAAFNTGLVTRHYDDIYACFEPNPGKNTPWKFLGFCVAARRGLGKRLVELFNPLPQTATYFSRKEDLLYDLNKELHSDFEHIIVENIHRFPLEFLAEHCYNVPEVQEIIDELKEMPVNRRGDLYDELRDIVSDNDRVYNRIKNRIEDAIEFALKMVRWNFKTALPSYYPAADTMSLMLPLFLREQENVDNVLVVELTRSGNYQGQTILTPQQAYVDARLVCRPNSDWLSPDSKGEIEAF